MFDQNALASASIQHTLSLILNPTRLARLQQQNLADKNQLSITEVASILHNKVVDKVYKNSHRLNHQSAIDLLYSNYINLIQDSRVSIPVKIEVYGILLEQQKYLKKKLNRIKPSSNYFAFYNYQLNRIKNIVPKSLKNDQLIQLPKMPPGSPI